MSGLDLKKKKDLRGAYETQRLGKEIHTLFLKNIERYDTVAVRIKILSSPVPFPEFQCSTTGNQKNKIVFFLGFWVVNRPRKNRLATMGLGFIIGVFGEIGRAHV